MFAFLNAFDLLEFASHATDVDARKRILTANRALGIINFENLFSKVYCRHYELLSIRVAE